MISFCVRFCMLSLLVDLITCPPPRPDGKILIIGGGIANFTNVVATVSRASSGRWKVPKLV